MEISRTTKLYLSIKGDLPGPVLDYGSRNGELAELTGGIFADHRLYNRPTKGQAQYVARGQEITGDFSDAVLTAQFDTELNLQLARELLSILQTDNHLYILLPAGYSVEPYLSFPVTHRVLGEPRGEQVIELRRGAKSSIDISERTYRYTLDVAGKRLTLEAGSGVFSPSEVDAGTRVLLDVLQLRGGHVLDLACGNGVMGLWAQVNGASSVTMLDADLRALRYAQQNAAANGVVAEIVAGDGLKAQDWRDKFNYILCNPPYHSDYSVAKGFIEDGFRALTIGGSMWLVVKNPTWYREKMKNVFGGARVIEQDGYSIVMGEKRGARPAQVKSQGKEHKTTRKHEKRMARVGRGR